MKKVIKLKGQFKLNFLWSSLEKVADWREDVTKEEIISL